MIFDFSLEYLIFLTGARIDEQVKIEKCLLKAEQ